jgi:hypothetical protein
MQIQGGGEFEGNVKGMLGELRKSILNVTFRYNNFSAVFDRTYRKRQSDLSRYFNYFTASFTESVGIIHLQIKNTRQQHVF